MSKYAIKYSNAQTFEPITMEKWFDIIATKKASNLEDSVKRDSGNKIIAEYNPSEYVLNHVTAFGGVNLEPGSDYKIEPESSKFVNANGDSWSNPVIKQHYKDFVGGRNFIEHTYTENNLVGVILDAVLRYISKYNVYYVDVLLATNKAKNPMLTKDISNGEYDVSVGIPFTYYMCSQCGLIHTTEDWNKKRFCLHLRDNLKGYYTDSDGKKKIVAMVNGSEKDLQSIKPFEVSWVRRPAFKFAKRHYDLSGVIKSGMDDALKKSVDESKILVTSKLYGSLVEEAQMYSAKRSAEEIAYDNMSDKIEEWLNNGEYSKVAAYTNYVRINNEMKVSDELDDLLSDAKNQTKEDSAPSNEEQPSGGESGEEKSKEPAEKINDKLFRDKNIQKYTENNKIKNFNVLDNNTRFYE